jgi:excisionase family DNA binding protein
MTDQTSTARDIAPMFYTVSEAARILRVDPATIYRAIRAGEFPAVRVRTRYIVPARAVDRIAAIAAASGACVDVARLAAASRLPDRTEDER